MPPKSFSEMMLEGFGWPRLLDFLKRAATRERMDGDNGLIEVEGDLADAIINGHPRKIPGHWWDHVAPLKIEESLLCFDHTKIGEPEPIVAEAVSFDDRLQIRLKRMLNPPLSVGVANMAAYLPGVTAKREAFITWMEAERNRCGSYPPIQRNKHGRDGWRNWATDNGVRRDVVKTWVDENPRFRARRGHP